MAMKKTSKQYVYDALDYMRKPSVDIALKPIEDTDLIMDTYGFEHKDICKLLMNIELDANVHIPHEAIHKVEEQLTVSMLIDYIELICNVNIKGKRISEEMPIEINDAIFILKALEAVSKSFQNLANTLSDLNTLKSFSVLLDVPSNYMKELDDNFFNFVHNLKKCISEIDDEKYEDKITDLKSKDFKKEMLKNLEYYKELFTKAYERS